MRKQILPLAILSVVFIAATIDLNHPDDYEGQTVPVYILKDNTPTINPVTNAVATLGRVLFYDKQLSLNNTISCGSCHQQQFAFGDTAQLSAGLTGGLTGRHSMRLVNSRFADEVRFFWDERATSLEDQTTRPIQDHVEMGYSGTNGQPALDSLIRKMQQISYYNILFEHVFGDMLITEERMQNALAQFVRSIQSFDSRFDFGRAQVNNLNAPFPNYSQLENQGKTLFLNPPPQGGAGCQGCHRAPEFDIDPNSLNNGVVGVAGNNNSLDLTNTRAPSLRDLFNQNGMLNGPMMHNGIFTDIQQIINHYNQIPNNPNNTNLDNRLAGPGGNLQLTIPQRDALIAFLRTLSGTSLYTDPKWSDPFDSTGNLTLIPLTTGIAEHEFSEPIIYPNPADAYVMIAAHPGNYRLRIFNTNGQMLAETNFTNATQQDIENFPSQIFYFEITSLQTGNLTFKKILKGLH